MSYDKYAELFQNRFSAYLEVPRPNVNIYGDFLTISEQASSLRYGLCDTYFSQFINFRFYFCFTSVACHAVLQINLVPIFFSKSQYLSLPHKLSNSLF